MRIVLTIATPKNGSYVVNGEGAGLRLAVNDALREYEAKRIEKKWPSLNRLAKMQALMRFEARLTAESSSDEE